MSRLDELEALIRKAPESPSQRWRYDELADFIAASRSAVPWLLELVRDAEELLIAAHFNNGTELEDKRRGWLRRSWE